MHRKTKEIVSEVVDSDSDVDDDGMVSELLTGFLGAVGKNLGSASTSKSLRFSAAALSPSPAPSPSYRLPPSTSPSCSARPAAVQSAPPQGSLKRNVPSSFKDPPSDGKVPKGRGKQSKIPVDTDELLNFENVTSKVNELEAAMAPLRSAPFDVVLPQLAELHLVTNVLKSLVKVSKTFQSDMKTVGKKLSLRQCTPPRRRLKLGTTRN